MKLIALVNIRYSPLQSENKFPLCENFVNEKISLKVFSLSEVPYTLREENKHFVEQAMVFWHFQMKANYFLTLQRPD